MAIISVFIYFVYVFTNCFLYNLQRNYLTPCGGLKIFPGGRGRIRRLRQKNLCFGEYAREARAKLSAPPPSENVIRGQGKFVFIDITFKVIFNVFQACFGLFLHVVK